MQMESVRALWSDCPPVDAMVARKALMLKPASARGGHFDAHVLKAIRSLLSRFMGATLDVVDTVFFAVHTVFFPQARGTLQT